MSAAMVADTLGYAEIAQLAGVTVGAVRSYRARGYLPEPDVWAAADRPRWHRSTITGWLAARPGSGNHAHQ
jgi:hypothetical protein